MNKQKSRYEISLYDYTHIPGPQYALCDYAEDIADALERKGLAKHLCYMYVAQTSDGRSYFRDYRKQRFNIWLDRLVPSLIAIIGTLGGTLLGWYLAHI